MSRQSRMDHFATITNLGVKNIGKDQYWPKELSNLFTMSNFGTNARESEMVNMSNSANSLASHLKKLVMKALRIARSLIDYRYQNAN